MKITEKAVLEARQLTDRAWKLAQGSASDRKEADVLLAQAAIVRETGFSKEERDQMEQRAILAAKETRYSADFLSYVRGKKPEAEMRFSFNEYWGRPTSQSYTGGDLQGGTSSGVAGGYTVPVEFQTKMLNAMAQYTDLMHPELVTLDVSRDYSLRGKVFPAWDLSTYKARRVSDVTQVSPNDAAIPAAYAKFEVGKIYKTSLAIALELEQDSAADGNIIESLTKAYGVAFGRGIGSDLIGGNGETGSGLLAGAVDSQYNEPLTLDFLYDLYFSLNRYHRASSRCAWVMHDDAYNTIRRLKDNNGRPLISIDEDGEKIFGKRVVVSPDMPNSAATSSPAVSGKVIFGNLEHFIVRISSMTVTRSLQSGLPNGVGDVTRGECLLNGRMRADSVVLDASNGAVPPVVFASFPTRN